MVRCYNFRNVIHYLSTGGFINGFTRFYRLFLVVSHSCPGTASSCRLLSFFRVYRVQACWTKSDGSEKRATGDTNGLIGELVYDSHINRFLPACQKELRTRASWRFNIRWYSPSTGSNLSADCLRCSAACCSTSWQGPCSVSIVYQYCIASLKRDASSFSPAGRGDSFVTRCCGRVPSTSLGMSASLKPTSLSPLGIWNRLK